jgi:hypothetical protein
VVFDAKWKQKLANGMEVTWSYALEDQCFCGYADHVSSQPSEDAPAASADPPPPSPLREAGPTGLGGPSRGPEPTGPSVPTTPSTGVSFCH